MVLRRKYDPTNKKLVFATLRREILAARLKVTLDAQLNRETSPVVMALSMMNLPPIVRRPHRGNVGEGSETASLTRKERLFNVLRREIRAARLKVVLDEQLNRESSPTAVALSRMALPPLVGLDEGIENGNVRRAYDPTNKEQVFERLRREIRAAQLKVSLDEELGRETSPTVIALSRMQPPPTDGA